MTHVALTCPRLLFTIGFELTARAGHRDPRGTLARELEAFGTVRSGGGAKWFVVELVDSQDAVLAYHALRTQRRDEMTLVSIVGSAAAAELFTAPTVATAWASVREDLLPPLDASLPPDDFSRGIAAARHFTPIIMRQPPDEITDARLPDAPLVLWSVAQNEAIAIDHEPFEMGQLRFDRGADSWRVEDRGGESVVMVNGQWSGTVGLAPGMVIQLALPKAYVVLAVQP
jgi:hypothetical protein